MSYLLAIIIVKIIQMRQTHDWMSIQNDVEWREEKEMNTKLNNLWCDYRMEKRLTIRIAWKWAIQIELPHSSMLHTSMTETKKENKNIERNDTKRLR